ncbi:hypothetical protein ASZ90_010116 [hydrocarbon metagenome]|uniref:Uncharacterized protein n=1 Tax=hydrocarbon metagenome TaxID=938273 RepID=A0A0W8FGY1_9ZZZZ|nr:DUF167 domain-containing protein [Methanomicrobiaceae archaeon]
MNTCADAVAETDDGVIIALDVSAGAKNASFPAGYNIWRKSVRCQVTPPAVGGKANRAIIALIAEVLAVPRSDVRIISGAASSSKVVHIAGRRKDEILAALDPLL